jgi:cation:H+ antiporter
MSDFWFHAVVFLVSFLVIWAGSGLVVSSVSSLARSWKLSAFTVSFFLLGILTSLPEIAIGATSLVENTPAISVGNLLGGIIVLFLLIIPLLGTLGNGVKIPQSLSQKEIFFILAVVLAPSLLTADQRLSPWEGILLIVLYVVLFLFLFNSQSVMEKLANSITKHRKNSALLCVKILVGVVLLLIASHQIVNSTLYFAGQLKVTAFMVSFLIVSLGTNIPEITIIFRSLIQRKKDIALADYLGSAVANTPLMGILSVLYGKPILLPNHAIHRIFFLTLGLILFFIFARSKRTLSRTESLILLSCYAAFLIFEFVQFAV